ncbi:MAG: tripartite tricarboxylate transporter TctB family protein [Pseudolabrys sp.]
MNDRLSKGGVGERVFAGAIGIVFAGQFLMALRYPPDPRLFPLIVSAAGFLLAVVMLFGPGLHDRDLGAPESLTRRSLILILAVSPAYGVALWLFGYWISTIIAIPLIAWMLGYRRRSMLAIVTAAVAVALGVLFPLLEVPLPVGLLPAMIGF